MDTFQGHFDGQYVILARNPQHAQALLNSEKKLLHSLINNQIPIIFQEDLHRMPNHIAIIPDYFVTRPIQIQNVLCFQTLYTKSFQLNKIKRQKERKLTRSNTFKHNPIKEDRLFQILNIEKKRDLIIKEDECYSFGDFSQKVDNLVEQAFIDEYKFGVFIVTYENLGFSHVNLLYQVIRLFIQKKNNRMKILLLLNFWLQYRQVDLINDCSIFCTIFMQFIELLQLFYLDTQNLEYKIQAILNGKKQKFTMSLSAPSPTGLFRKQSFHHPKKERKFRNLSVQLNEEQGIPKQMKPKFDGNHFYLNCSTETLQKQLWIIDIELFSQISITSLLDTEQLIKNNDISDYFDYLLFHMIFSTVVSSKDEKFILINKFIELYINSKEAKDYQLMHVLYCYFNHDIVQTILEKIYPLNSLNKLILDEIINKELYKTIISIDIYDRQGIIPCFGMILLYIYKYQDIRDKHYQIIENKWILLSQQLFQISHLQMLIQLLNGCQHLYRDDYVNGFLRNGMKNQLIDYFGCKKQCIEIQMFKIFFSE